MSTIAAVMSVQSLGFPTAALVVTFGGVLDARRLGRRTVAIETSELNLARVTTDPTAAWRAEVVLPRPVAERQVRFDRTMNLWWDRRGPFRVVVVAVGPGLDDVGVLPLVTVGLGVPLPPDQLLGQDAEQLPSAGACLQITAANALHSRISRRLSRER